MGRATDKLELEERDGVALVQRAVLAAVAGDLKAGLAFIRDFIRIQVAGSWHVNRVEKDSDLGIGVIGDERIETAVLPSLGFTLTYLRHKDEFDKYINKEREEGEKIRHEIEKNFSPAGIRERLLKRRQNQDAS
ncbi:MAG: hypothetical protein HY717_02600 [Planctomycetes bacterium]|nr:hypothetical protein [Planctomycetota bacterium]